MKLEECMQCKYHSKVNYDNVVCLHHGSMNYHVVSGDRKGDQAVLMCPLETAHVTRSASEWYCNVRLTHNTPAAELTK